MSLEDKYSLMGAVHYAALAIEEKGLTLLSIPTPVAMQYIFPVYGASGGLTSNYIFYIMKKGKHYDGLDLGTGGLSPDGDAWGVLVYEDSAEKLYEKIQEGIKALNG